MMRRWPVVAILALVALAALAQVADQYLDGDLIVAGDVKKPDGRIYLFDAPSDGNTYGRSNASWVVAGGGGGGGGITDAPADNIGYVRRNNVWIQSAWSYLTGTPTTLGGYGITDGVTAAQLAAHAATTHGTHGITTWSATFLDDTNAAQARATLELGNSATRNVGTTSNTVAHGDHNHAGVYDPAGTAATAVATHEAAGDPHSQYYNQSRGDARYLTRNGAVHRAWTAADTDIDAVVPGGSTFGSILEGVVNGHMTVGLRSNDSGDNFSVISKESGNTNYTRLIMSARADGLVTVPASISVGVGGTIAGNTIWHAGNDGAGSGLDADLLDGQHGSYYLARSNHTGTQPWSTITGTPTTLGGYGITDAIGEAPNDGNLYARQSLGWSLFTPGAGGITDAPSNGVAYARRNAGWSAISFSDITNRPTTVAGYGITNAGTVTSVTMSGGATGLTYTGNPITNAGVITLTGNLNIAHGGTGATTASGARTQLGLGNSAVLNVGTGAGTVAAGDHLHDGRYLQLAGALHRAWSVADTDIDSLLPGSTFGSIKEGVANAHYVIGLRSNDAGDSFAVVSKENANPDYSRLLFRVGALGNAEIPGSLTIAGNTTWHAGNHGPGSGLNADLLDGHHYADVVSRGNHTGTQPWSTITGTPTTVAGYGITNAIHTGSANQVKVGMLSVQGHGMGRVSLVSGNATNAGYIAFHAPDGTRRGYIGWKDPAQDRLLLDAEAGYSWQFNDPVHFISAGNTMRAGAAGAPATHVPVFNEDPTTGARFILSRTATQLLGDMGGVPTSRSIFGAHSIAGGGNLSADRSFQLVGDVAAPGVSRYYGTDGSGARGWFSLPVASGGDMLRSVYDINGNNIVDASESVPWTGVTGKPATFPPSAHTHPATDIHDSSAIGRSILTAGDAASQRSILGLGNSATRNVGLTAGTVAEGDHGHALTSASITGILPGSKGGTGTGTYTVGDILVGSGGSSLTKMSAVAAGAVLKSQGVATVPAWGAVNIGTETVGVLGIGQGGTAANTAAGARANLGADNASNLTSGTLPAARLSGGYSGITSVGNLTSLSTIAGNTTFPATHFPVFTADPIDTSREIRSRTVAQVLSDIGAAPVSHTHSAGDIVSGVMATARLGSGTANSSTFLRGDGTWAATPGGGGGTVTSVSGSGGATGLSLTGGPITTSGTLTLGGTLSLSSGGTGASTAAGARGNIGLESPSTTIAARANHDTIVGATTVTRPAIELVGAGTVSLGIEDVAGRARVTITGGSSGGPMVAANFSVDATGNAFAPTAGIAVTTLAAGWWRVTHNLGTPGTVIQLSFSGNVTSTSGPNVWVLGGTQGANSFEIDSSTGLAANGEFEKIFILIY